MSTFQIFGNHGRRVLQAKEEKDHPDCYQCKVQKPASVMVLGCVSARGIGNLHICEGTINADRFWSNICCHPSNVFFRDVPVYFSKTMPSHSLSRVTTAWLCSRRVQLLYWPACSPDLSPNEWIFAKKQYIFISLNIQIIVFCFYLHFIQCPNFIGIGVCTSYVFPPMPLFSSR